MKQHAKYSATEIIVNKVIMAPLGFKIFWPHDDRVKEQVQLLFPEDQNIILFTLPLPSLRPVDME